MKINAQIVADSINQQGDRITTMLVTFPRFILAELNTHRMMSKNSASSRAIPFKKMVESVTNNPFIPIAWQKDHKGMQGNEYLDENHSKQALYTWLGARDLAVEQATDLYEVVGVTKQLCNRLLEPFMWHTVLITATEWENFFSLRCPSYEVNIFDEGQKQTYRSWKDLCKNHPSLVNSSQLDRLKTNKGQAEIHMMALAEAMWDAINESTPKELQPGEWHIPFEDKIDRNQLLDSYDKDNKLLGLRVSTNTNVGLEKLKVKISTAMAARTSYTVVGDEKEFGYDKQIELHDRMINQIPRHSSPMEHSAQAQNNSYIYFNLKGFKSYRYFLDKGLSIGSL